MLRNLRRGVCPFRVPLSRQCNSAVPGYIVLLPETPPESTLSVGTRELLNTNRIPTKFNYSSTDYQAAIGFTSLQFESIVWKVEQSLQDPQYDISTELLKDLDSSHLDYLISLVNIAHILHTLPNHEELVKRLTSAKNLKYTSKSIYYAFKDLLDSNPRSRELQLSVYLGKINGNELTPQAHEHLQQESRKHTELKNKFKKNVSNATAKFKHMIMDEKHLGRMTERQMKDIAHDKSNPRKGPWYVKLNKEGYTTFMENCPVPALRWNLWQAYNSRCADTKDNSVTIEDIRGRRRAMATLLGYRNFAEQTVEHKMAANVTNVKSMVATLLVKGRPKHMEEFERLQEFASKNGYNSKLKPWDIMYWRKLERDTLFNAEKLAIPFQQTMKALFAFTSELFGIEYKKMNDSLYSVFSKNEEVGSFIVDPYRSPSKFPGNYIIGNKHFSSMILNFDRPSGEEDTMLSVSDVASLFENFGSLLQTCVNAKHRNVGMLQDFRIGGYFLSLWLGNKDFVQKYLGLEGEALSNFLSVRNHLAATDLCYELYLADLDLELHLCENFWQDVVKKLWSTYNAYDLEKNQHLCSSPLIHYGSTYYCDIWSKMLGADCYRAFVESNEPRTVASQGQRLFNTVFEASDDSHPSEVFRSFRGRDPSVDAYLWSLGLAKMEKQKAT